jgi:hypothetical protein
MINQVTGQSLSAEEVQDLLQRTVDGAARLARTAAAPVVGDRAKLFEAVFDRSPLWRPPGAPWVLGGVVRKRFRLAAELLSSGTLWIGCFGLPGPAVGRERDEPDGYILRAIDGIYRIGLGRRFWDLVRDGDTASAEAALLVAALRVAFGLLIRFQRPGPPKNRGFCYMRYALYVAGRTIPGWIGSGCPIPPSRWNRLMPTPAVPATPPAPSGSGPTSTPPIRLRLSDEELERILGRPLTDPLSDHINWVIRQVPPTGAANPTLGDRLKRKLGEKVDEVSERLRVPPRLRKYVRQVAEGAARKGAKLVVEEGLRRIGIDSAEAIEAVWGTVERATQESP